MFTVLACGFQTSDVNELFAYAEFAKQYREHVELVCADNRVPADNCDRILRIAFERFRKSDNPAGYSVGWTLADEMEKLRPAERQAELDAEWEEIEAELQARLNPAA